jgi:hypothetical protein
MQPTSEHTNPATESYEITRMTGSENRNIVPLLGGLVGLFSSIIGFFVCIQLNIGQPGLTFISVMPATFGTLALIQYFSKSSKLSSIISDERGLTFRYPKREQLVRWEEMGLVERTSGMNHKPILNLYNRQGKHVATIDHDFHSFEELSQWLDQRVKSLAGESNYVMLKLKRHRRVGLGLAILGSFMLMGCGGLAWEAYSTNRSDKMLKTQGIAGQAEIVDMKTAPNGRTRRLYYQVVDKENKGPTENVEIDEATWNSLQGQKTVPVRYVPSDLGTSQLLTGQVFENNFTDTFSGKILLVSVGSAVSIGLLVMGILMQYGWNMETDPITKKTKLERIVVKS